MNPLEGRNVYYLSRSHGFVELVILDEGVDAPADFGMWNKYTQDDERVNTAVALLDAAFEGRRRVTLKGVGTVRYSDVYQGRAYALDLKLPTINGHTVF